MNVRMNDVGSAIIPSIDMASVAGVPFGGEVTPSGEGNRLYLVEVARFGPQGATGYQEYAE